MTDISSIVTNQALIMFIIMALGFFGTKTKQLSASTPKDLSAILLNVINPIVIFLSFQRAYDKTYVKGLLLCALLSVFALIIAILASTVFIKQSKKRAKTADGSELSIERFSSIYSNCGFMGIPLIQAVFGSDGVFYLSAFLAVFNIFIWTHGYLLIAGKSKKVSLAKILLSPSLIGVYAGLISFFSQMTFTGLILDCANTLAAINTPIAMIIAGATIASTDLRKAIINLRILIVSLVRLLIIPTILIICFGFMNVDETVKLTVIIVASAPTAALGTLLCVKLDKNYRYSSELFAVTTLLSIFTLPFVVRIYDFFQTIFFA